MVIIGIIFSELSELSELSGRLDVLGLRRASRAAH
jgi:hypothetical protein